MCITLYSGQSCEYEQTITKNSRPRQDGKDHKIIRPRSTVYMTYSNRQTDDDNIMPRNNVVVCLSIFMPLADHTA